MCFACHCTSQFGAMAVQSSLCGRSNPLAWEIIRPKVFSPAERAKLAMLRGQRVGIWLQRRALNCLYSNLYHPRGIGPPVSGHGPVETVSLWNDWLVHISDFQRRAVVFGELAKPFMVTSLTALCLLISSMGLAWRLGTLVVLLSTCS